MEGIQQAHQVALIDGAQHATHSLLGEVARAVRNGLVSQREGIPHRTGRRLSQQTQGRLLKGNTFVTQDVVQVTDNRIRGHLLEVELQATGEHCDRDFLWVCRCQNEFHVRRRLLERLEHGVERMAGEHVNLVDHVHLETTNRRCVDRLLKQLCHFIDATIGGGIELHIIDKPTLIDLHAGIANATGCWGDARLAIEGFGQNPGQGGLANATGTREKPSVMQPLRFERMGQRANDMILSNQRIERTRTPLASQHQICHGNTTRHQIRRRA